MKIHLISETPHRMRGQGVYTAFINFKELLKEKDDVEVIVNGEGWGDIFHAHTYGPYYFWKGRKYKGKRIHTAHVIPDSIKGSLPMWRYLYPIVKWYFKKVFSYADIVIAISPMVEKEIKKLGINTKIIKINNPIIFSKWKRTDENRIKGRNKMGLTDSDFIVLGVGQLQSRKGVEDFIEIAEAIPEAKFVWVGGRPFGILTEGIKSINAKIKKASKNVHFIGMVELEDMPSIYAASNILLFTSYQENCPLAPLEAAAGGLPVVFRDIIEYNLLYEHLYLKASGNAEFISIIKKLIIDNKFYKEGVKISEDLISQFDKEKIREQFINEYKILLGKCLSQ